MTTHLKKQFGIWMDTHHATIVGRDLSHPSGFSVVGHVSNPGADKNSNENAANHQEIALTHKFFKDIAATMPNVDEIHITGTGQIQEQFKKFLADTPQYKNAVSSDSTSNKMGDAELITFVEKHFHK